VSIVRPQSRPPIEEESESRVRARVDAAILMCSATAQSQMARPPVGRSPGDADEESVRVPPDLAAACEWKSAAEIRRIHPAVLSRM